MSTSKACISDRRTVDIQLSDGPLSYTPAGRFPIRCQRAEITYDIRTRQLCSVTVWGYLTSERDIKARGHISHNVIRRRYDVDWDTHQALHTPGWLDVLIEDYRPAGGAR